jgi:dihydroorotase
MPSLRVVGKLDKLEGFASDFGADFYRLPRNTAHPAREARLAPAG